MIYEECGFFDSVFRLPHSAMERLIRRDKSLSYIFSMYNFTKLFYNQQIKNNSLANIDQNGTH